MITSVSGSVLSVTGQAAVVEVGGVGLAVQCTPTLLATLRVGESARLATSLVVREDSLTLYGFADDDERTVFELLQTATGVGPRLAQAMLGVHPPDELRRIVATDDLAALVRVPGVGRKGAQRLVVELKDRLGPALPASTGGGAAVSPTGANEGWQGQVHSALVGLGWSAREADAAVASVAADRPADADADGEADVAGLLRAALRAMGPR